MVWYDVELAGKDGGLVLGDGSLLGRMLSWRACWVGEYASLFVYDVGFSGKDGGLVWENVRWACDWLMHFMRVISYALSLVRIFLTGPSNCDTPIGSWSSLLSPLEKSSVSSQILSSSEKGV